ncbi:DNA-directed RNA polymerase III subunit RPC7 [Glossina fuscipes]|uniref:DNA-directed RNA polymerase III subunit RPC7 n=1 Tax=Glossina fuscipes TaxID=7396 RepID=A0A9C5ZRM7_9MUSC|nr:DNA-directed RNA polymerase III subunit RPC7 [Glossina fuscipes]
MSGRGRGKTGTLTQEQLQSLGCVGKEMPQVQTAPPPTYPPLMTKSVVSETTAEQSYKILWKESFLTYIRDSSCYLELNGMADPDKNLIYQQKTCNDQDKHKSEAEFNWFLMPSELQVINKTRKLAMRTAKDATKPKQSRTANIENRLKLLEEKERDNDDIETLAKSESDQELEEEEIVDDEMDEENDYGNSYFDNGEAYNEEDDNMDDDPVY